ncbi:MAG: bifunctional DNA-formamidopyrimidine glycosylase/DNA-(apurinic or apyrimidinic site) lyase [Parachlamydiales bacterium]|nr:bifunctional DNA-formamidopyrimidine glycosylase/DNA-(apurinic or apyrimidinic site) lyase [Parachlamydiales bacterium]
MPELPEVETIAQDLIYNGIVNQVIESVDVMSPHLSQYIDNEILKKNILGSTIVGIHRRGKYLAFSLNNGFSLIVHFRMSGKILITPIQEPVSPHQHLLMTFSNELHIRFHDPRKFGRWTLTNNPCSVYGHLGPEPLTMTFDTFYPLLKRQRALKPLLLDQTVIAGLGNIYVDESLWYSKLHPLRPGCTLNKSDARSLYKAIQLSLIKGIESGGTTIGHGQCNYKRMEGAWGNNQKRLNVYQQQGNPCHHCGTKIIKIFVAQRGTHLCPTCQIHNPNR